MSWIEQCLRDDFGLNLAALGPAWLQRAVRQRLRALRLARIEDYERRLRESTDEWPELLESVLVRETWFFRDPEAFTALSRLAAQKRLGAFPGRPWRLLSVPCASGEEPFSMVMALLDAGARAEQFEVDAADLSARALQRARRGVYGRNSFRQPALDFRSGYFKPTPEGFAIDSRVRAQVRFIQANLLLDDFRQGQPSYDVIFCRNLLIYLDDQGRRRALSKIERLLTPRGFLFLAPAEQSVALDYGFVRTEPGVSCACRKPGPSAAVRWNEITPNAATPLAKNVADLWAHKSAASPSAVSDGLWPPGPQHTAPCALASLDGVRQLTDNGRLAEAAALCEAHLRESRTSAQAYYLLGRVREAGGDARAIDCYRRALYLQPDHYESLLQMAVLAGKNGDPTAARNFRRRAQRTRSHSKSA